MIWLGDSLRELKAFPAAVRDEMGYAIYLAQCGQTHASAKPLRGLGFQKKSKRGIATPKADIELIERRLKQAVDISKSKTKE